MLGQISSAVRKVLFVHEVNLGFLEEATWEELSRSHEAWWSAANPLLKTPSSSNMKSFQMNYRRMLIGFEAVLDGYLSSVKRLEIDQNDGDKSQRNRMTRSEERESLGVMHDIVEALKGDIIQIYDKLEVGGIVHRRVGDGDVDDNQKVAAKSGFIGALSEMMEKVKQLHGLMNGDLR